MNWRKDQYINILVKEYKKPLIKKILFKIQKDNKFYINFKHLVYYTLLQIICIDNYCKIYKTLKEKNYKYFIINDLIT